MACKGICLNYAIRLSHKVNYKKGEVYCSICNCVFINIIRCPCCNYYTRHSTRNAKSKREYNITIK